MRMLIRKIAALSLLLLGLALPGLAQGFGPSQISAMVADEKPLDGITVRAVGQGGRYRKHRLQVDIVISQPAEAERTLDWLTRERSQQEAAVTKAMEAFGFTHIDNYTYPMAVGFGGMGGRLNGGGFGGGSRSPSDIQIHMQFQVPDGICDGSVIAGHTRESVVDAAVRAGGEPTLILRSESDFAHTEKDWQEALDDAFRRGKALAQQLAKAVGVKLGKPRGVHQPIDSLIFNPPTRELYLTQNQISPENQNFYTRHATVVVRYAIK
jgi:hypothetical protein